MVKKYIPDCVTSLNLLCGAMGIVCAFDGRLDLAFPLMIAGAVFDFCDGLLARALDAYSELGKELDSLSDVVTFGVLPSMMLVCLMRECVIPGGWYCWTPLVLAVASGLRLAKFNVDERQRDSFLGLATTISALCSGSLAYYVAFAPAGNLALVCAQPWFVPVIALGLSVLLLSEIPMFCFKQLKCADKSLRGKRMTFILEAAILVAAVALLRLNWSLAVCLVCLLYILKNVLYAIFKA